MELKKLAQAIKLTEKIKEESYDSVSLKYKTGNLEAYFKTAEKLNLDIADYTIMYMLLVNSWNESIEWADAYIEKYSN